jgi:sec-independent protein translocase protein TatC
MSTPRLRSIQLSPVHRLLVVLAAAAESMTFLEHLDELRRRLLWSVVSVVAAFCVCWIFATDLYEIARAPINANPAVTLAIGRPQDIFSLHMKVTLVAAFFVSAPLVLLQAWLFIAPGLHAREKRYAVPFIASGSVLFAAGGAFGYYVAFPAALTFLLDWTTASRLVPIIDAVEYFDLFLSIIVALGIVFQIPAVIFVLSRVGLVTARLLLRHFKHAVVACVVLAAVLTPTTDFGNMLIIAGPMIVLYAVGIVIAFVFGA